jgi:hypothetical protein
MLLHQTLILNSKSLENKVFSPRVEFSIPRAFPMTNHHCVDRLEAEHDAAKFAAIHPRPEISAKILSIILNFPSLFSIK